MATDSNNRLSLKQELKPPSEILIHQLFEDQVLKNPKAIAVVFQDQQLTYEALNKKANQVAHYLRSLSIATEQLVGVCLERTLDLLIILLGILKAGAAYVPLDPTHPKNRLEWVIADAQMPILLTQTHLINNLPQSNTQLIAVDQVWEAIAQQPTENPASLGTAENLAYVMYTSGSTGKPKGVQIQHGGVVNFLKSMRDDRPGLTAEDVLLAVTTPTFDISVLELFLPLATGATVVIVPGMMTKNGVELAEALEKYEITVMQATPATWQMLIQAGWSGTPGLKVLVGGEPLPRELANQLLDRCSQVWNMYGPTETTIWSTCQQITAREGTISIGQPIAQTQIYILNEQLQLLSPGEIGELYIGGAGLALGYLNRPELTAERFIPNPFDNNGNSRIYKTGDLARFMPDGSLECLGRIDHQVKIRGFRIELGEIEALLWQHSDVQSAVVVAREEIPGHKRLVGYVVPERIPYQSLVSVKVNDQFSIKLTTDISSQGISVVDAPSSWQPGQRLCLQLTLPGDSNPRQFQGKISGCQGNQAGIQFLLTPAETEVVQNSLDYLLKSQGLSKVLERSLVNNLREYLQDHLPEYMVPTNLVVLSAFPLTPNGKVDRIALPAPKRLSSESDATWLAPRNAVEQELVRIWQTLLNWEQLSILDTFQSLGGNSLLTVQMLTEVRRSFETNVSLSHFLENPTIAGLACAIAKASQSEPLAEEKTVLNWSAKSKLDPTIVPSLNPPESIPQIFLTGTTGFLGTHLLAELLQQTRADVYCLVRSPNPAEGQAKIENTLKHYHLWQEHWHFRIYPVLGDLSQPCLGLDSDIFSRLAEKIDTIYHCGAWVNILYPYTALEAANVTGTQEVLRLASQTKIKPVHFISTVDVFAHYPELGLQVVGETDPIGPGNHLYRGYAQTKFVAENLVKTAHTRGIPVAIYRPSNIMGSSKIGISQTSGFIAKMIKGCIQMGSAPELNAALNLVPVDYASRAIVQLASTQALQGQAFHIVNPQFLMWKDLVNWINHLGYPLKELSYEAWVSELSRWTTNAKPGNPLVPLANLFANPNFIQKSLGAFYFKSDNAIKGLANTGITCPLIDAEALMTYFGHFIHSGFLESPAHSPELLVPQLLTRSDPRPTEYQQFSSHSDTRVNRSAAISSVHHC